MDPVSSIPLRETPAGVSLPIQAAPGARKNGVTGVHNGRLKVAVTQVAEKGKANRELIRTLAELLGLRRNAVTLASGETSPLKEFEIAGLTADELRARLRAVL